MAIISPFRAWRYDPERVPVQQVVTQPYDKITPAMQESYYQASPYNLVRIILGKRLPADSDSENAYTRAAAAFRDWRQTGVLRRDPEPSLYRYTQTFPLPDDESTSAGPPTHAERRGFIALGRLESYSAGVVFRHEQTLTRPKADRLDLLRATRAHFGQIFMLYSGAGKVNAVLDSATDNPADIEVNDEYGVVHRVWRISDPSIIASAQEQMRTQKLIIADGHHRYETSVAYAKERSAQLKLPLGQPLDPDEKLGPGHLPAPPFPEAAMMMTFVNSDAPGITILPTHRVVFGLEDFSSPDFITKASEYYTVTDLPDFSSGSELVERLTQTAGDPFIAATGDGNYMLAPKPEAIAPLMESLPAKQRQLGVGQLHAVVLDHLLGLDPDTITRLGKVHYIRDAQEAVALVESGKANIAFLIKPVTLDQLRDVSLSGEVMPQKSTDFYPKLLSGLAIYALD